MQYKLFKQYPGSPELGFITDNENIIISSKVIQSSDVIDETTIDISKCLQYWRPIERSTFKFAFLLPAFKNFITKKDEIMKDLFESFTDEIKDVISDIDNKQHIFALKTMIYHIDKCHKIENAAAIEFNCFEDKNTCTIIYRYDYVVKIVQTAINAFELYLNDRKINNYENIKTAYQTESQAAHEYMWYSFYELVDLHERISNSESAASLALVQRSRHEFGILHDDAMIFYTENNSISIFDEKIEIYKQPLSEVLKDHYYEHLSSL